MPYLEQPHPLPQYFELEAEEGSSVLKLSRAKKGLTKVNQFFGVNGVARDELELLMRNSVLNLKELSVKEPQFQHNLALIAYELNSAQFMDKIGTLMRQHFPDVLSDFRHCYNFLALRMQAHLVHSLIDQIANRPANPLQLQSLADFKGSQTFKYIIHELQSALTRIKSELNQLLYRAQCDLKPTQNDSQAAQKQQLKEVIVISENESELDNQLKESFRILNYQIIQEMNAKYKATKDMKVCKMILRIVCCHVIKNVFKQDQIEKNFQ